jgi:hypothetical protein
MQYNSNSLLGHNIVSPFILFTKEDERWDYIVSQITKEDERWDYIVSQITKEAVRCDYFSSQPTK